MREVKRPGAVDAAPGPRGMILRTDPSIAAPSHSAQESLIEHAEWTSRIAAASRLIAVAFLGGGSRRKASAAHRISWMLAPANDRGPA